jgi:ATP-dependent Lhr-like helicase
VVEGEWCGTEVSRLLRQRSLARARAKVAPVDQGAFTRFRLSWQGLDQPRRGLDGLLDVIEQLQGLPLPVSTWEEDVLPARVAEFDPDMLDELCAAGEVVWRGVATGASSRTQRVAFFLTDDAPRLSPPSTPLEGAEYERLRALLRERGALFFDQLIRTVGGFPNELIERLWELVWNGEVTNDTLVPLRRRLIGVESSGSGRGSRLDDAFRSRRQRRLPGSEGRWWLFERGWGAAVSPTERQTALATQLLKRYGVVTREAVLAEDVPGGFSAIYPVLKAFEEAGRVHRGYFVADLGAAQFAAPGADQRLRLIAEPDRRTETGSHVVVLAALDPASPFGTAIPFPVEEPSARLQRVEGARVVLRDGRIVAYLYRGGQAVWTFLGEGESCRADDCRAIARVLASLATASTPVFLSSINGALPGRGPLEPHLLEAGFIATAQGYLHRRRESG